VFYLAYHLHWGHDEVMSLATGDRREYVRMVVEENERQQRELDEARRRPA
jgi:Family of unknown function (DUF6760)